MAADDGEAATRPPGRKAAVREFSEDLTGFGGAELRTTRDLYLRPSRVLDAYEAGASDLGGYTRPFRYYLSINGLYLLLIAVTGGFGRMLHTYPPDVIEQVARWSGKSVQATGSDLDKWYSLLAVPLLAAVLFGPLYLLFRRWSGAEPRIAFRQVFTFLSCWTLYGAPFGLLIMWFPVLAPVNFVLFPLILAVIFPRLGRGRWWRSIGAAWGKGLLLFVVVVLSSAVAGALALAVTVGAVVAMP